MLGPPGVSVTGTGYSMAMSVQYIMPLTGNHMVTLRVLHMSEEILGPKTPNKQNVRMLFCILNLIKTLSGIVFLILKKAETKIRLNTFLTGKL